jgi:hypothetical protein
LREECEIVCFLTTSKEREKVNENERDERMLVN